MISSILSDFHGFIGLFYLILYDLYCYSFLILPMLAISYKRFFSDLVFIEVPSDDYIVQYYTHTIDKRWSENQ